MGGDLIEVCKIIKNHFSCFMISLLKFGKNTQLRGQTRRLQKDKYLTSLFLNRVDRIWKSLPNELVTFSVLNF